MRVTICEEAPGVNPHWFIYVPGIPMFETHEEAELFCDFMNWEHTTEYFNWEHTTEYFPL